jgi:hypothetical protein
MKNLLFIFITLITIANVSYASFPVTENIKSVVLASTDSEDPKKTPPLFVFILPWLIPLLLFYLVRGYKRDVDWIRKLIRWKNIWWLLLLLPLQILVYLIGGG